MIVRRWRAFLAGPPWTRDPAPAMLVFRLYRSPLLVAFLWLMAWYERIFSKPARLLLIVFIVTAFFSSVSTRSPSLGLFFLLSSLATVDFLAGWLFRPKLSVTRQIPRRVRCGADFDVRYQVQCLNRHLPCPDVLPDPDMEYRHLTRSDGLLYRSFGPGEISDFSVRFRALKRGPMPIPECLFESTFPFNLFKHARRFGGGRTTLLVHPFYRVYDRLPLEAGRSLRRRADATLPQPGESMEFHGCRKFRTGDSRRRIHWRASAKHQTLIVKEFQQEYQSRAVLITDSFLPTLRHDLTLRRIGALFTRDLFSDDAPALEAALSLSAGIAASLSSHGSPLSLFACGDTVLRFSADRNIDAAPEVLDALALQTRSDHDPFPGWSKALAEEWNAAGFVFLVLARYDDSARKFHQSLLAAGVPLYTAVTTSHRPRNLPDSVHWLSPAMVLSGRAEL